MPLLRMFSSLALPLLLAGMGAFYLVSLPLHVQGGDTGELVAAAYRGLVAHPPGYPLWIWLERLWVSLFSYGTVFWRASLLTMLFALAALLCLALPLRRSPLVLVLCVTLLGLSASFLEAALLPDVFSLHALFLAAIGALFLFGRPGSNAVSFGIPFLFCLSLSHQLTAVLLLPVAGFVSWQAWRDPKARRLALLGFFLGSAAALSLYSSLLLLDTRSPFSWGELVGPASLLAHFLRSDYGSFSLAPGGSEGGLAPLAQLVRASLVQLVPFMALVAWMLRRPASPDPRLLAWGGATLLSLAFFFFLNVRPEGAGADVLLRFHLMPVLQLVFLGAFVLHRAWGERPGREVGWGCVLVLLASLPLLRGALDAPKLRNDSLFEDYALNYLAQAEGREPALLLANGDSAYFSLRYAQLVLGEGEGVAVLVPALLFHPWYYEKARALAPALQVPERVRLSRVLDLDADLVRPNLGAFKLLVSQGFQGARGLRLTYLGLGRVLEQGAGTSFDEGSPAHLRFRTRFGRHAAGFQGFSKKALYAQYAHFHLGQGLALLAAGRKEEAKASWERALQLVPFALPALENLCRLEESDTGRCVPEARDALAREAEGLF